MSDSTSYRFSTETGAEFSVARFHGREAISEPYRYTLELRSTNADIDMDAMLSQRCTFTRTIGGVAYPVHGVLAEFELYGQMNEYSLYRAVLVPRLWQLSLYRTNEVYLDKSVPEIIEMVLNECGLTSLDYRLQLVADYPAWEYRCQYNETHFDFVSRLMEHEGIYYYFAQEDDAEQLIITDNRNIHEAIEPEELDYAPPTGLDHALHRVVHSLVCRTQRMPQSLVLKDFDYQRPTLDLAGRAGVDSQGIGEIYVYGENFTTEESGAYLARMRAEAIRCTKERFHGESVVPGLQPGYRFGLAQHFRRSFNQDYLLLEVEHRGYDPLSPLPLAQRAEAADPAYYNSFTAIPSATQFRPQSSTPKPRFYGTINARIDAEGDGQYAEVDNQGRYRVVLPFDRVLRAEGKASHWLRMQQPYAGANEGMHFPLRKGTEVLLTFIDGDPDRPVISGAIPNGANPNVVNEENQTNNLIKTASGNRIEMEDRDGTNRIKFQTGDNKTYMHMGAPNHAGDGWVVITEGMERKEIQGGQQITLLAAPLAAGETARTIAETGSAFNARSESNEQAFNELAKVPDGTGIKLFETPAPTGTVTGSWQYRVGTGAWTSLETNLSSSRWRYMTQDYQLRFVPTRSNTGAKGSVSLKYIEVPEPTPSGVGNPADYAFGTVSSSKDITVPQYPFDTQVHEGIRVDKFSEGWVAVTANTPTASDQGKWQLSVDAATTDGSGMGWEDYPYTSLSTTKALFLQKNNQLRYIPYPKEPGNKYLHIYTYTDGHNESWKFANVPNDSCAAVEKTLDEETTIYFGYSPQPGGGRCEYKRGSGGWTSANSTVTLNSGDKIRFIPEAKTYGTRPSISYLTGQAAGIYTTTLSTSGMQTETLQIEVKDLIDEQALWTFSKLDHDGQAQASAAMTRDNELSGNYLIARHWGDSYRYVRGDSYSYSDVNAREFTFSNRFEVNVNPPAANATAASPSYADGFSESDLKALIDKMTTVGFGATVPTGVERYSQTTSGGWSGKSDLEKWRELLANGHVIINHRDEFKTHEGNLYDFGGYWNYNLGNSYAEDHIDQGAELNKRHTVAAGSSPWKNKDGFTADPIAGPNSGTIKTERGDVSLHTDSTWVEKKFGDSYEFSMGDTLEISHGTTESHSSGNSYEYNYGGEHQETKYDGAGTKRLWERSGANTSETKKWNRHGTLMEHTTTDQEVGLTSYSKIISHTNDFEMKLSAASSFSMHLGASTNFTLEATGSTNTTVSGGVSLDLKLSAAFSLEGEISGAWKMELIGGDKFKMQGPGTEIENEKAFKVEVQKMMIGNMAMQMKKKGIVLGDDGLTFKNKPIDMKVGMKFNL